MIKMLRAVKRTTLGELAELCECPMCEGSGSQREEVWAPGMAVEEREVSCFMCRGAGQVVALMCPSCGEADHVRAELYATDEHVCEACGRGHEGFMWLPMRRRAMAAG